jgi:hypothetical protein
VYLEIIKKRNCKLVKMANDQTEYISGRCIIPIRHFFTVIILLSNLKKIISR